MALFKPRFHFAIAFATVGFPPVKWGTSAIAQPEQEEDLFSPVGYPQVTVEKPEYLWKLYPVKEK